MKKTISMLVLTIAVILGVYAFTQTDMVQDFLWSRIPVYDDTIMN